MHTALLEEMLRRRAANESFAVLTRLPDGEQQLVERARLVTADLSASLREAVEAALRGDRSTVVEDDGQRWFVHVHNPRLRMLIVGAVHITQALAALAPVLGYAVTVVDPRRAFATSARFPGVELLPEWPDDAFERLAPDARTAVVTLTHDPKIDDPALIAALRSDAFYIGSLGSRRTHAGRCTRLRKAGFDDTDLARIDAPVGLDIGARSAAEIAAATLAAVTLALRSVPEPKPPSP